jgi:L-histidine Nalpha-methyltransferase / hercynylcysteine S-oxide synthase
MEEWEQLWKAWDMVTLQMIPEDLLQEKPILLRHPCIFYIGKSLLEFFDARAHSYVLGYSSNARDNWNAHASSLLYSDLRTRN